MAPQEAWYVYGVLPAGAPPPGRGAIVPGGVVEAVPMRRLAALVSRVRRALFDCTDPSHRTADPGWMGERVQAYHAVNAAAAAAGPFLPLAFGTVFSTLDRLGDWLEPREAVLHAALGRVAGQAEWVLSLEVDTDVQSAWLERHDPTLRDLVAAVAASGEGTAFLLTRRLEMARQAARVRQDASAAEAVEVALADAEGDAPLTVLADPSRRGRPTWSVLAPSAVSARRPDWRDRLDEVVADLAPRGLSLRLSGPWPAYTFARAIVAADPVAGTLAGEAGHA